jgi:allantoate deiminase
MTVLQESLAENHAKRAVERCLMLSKISENDGSILRQYLTEEHSACNQKTAEWMQQAGMITWQDEVGNQWGRLVSTNPNAKRLIVGSHLDTVPNAGAYDGILGVMLGIELAALSHQQALELPFHLDVVGFCDEEGTRFSTTLIGSKALAGEFDTNWLALEDINGTSMASAMSTFGLDPNQVCQARLNSDELVGYWETHIEQGPVLEDQNQALGVVTAIAGAKRAMVSFCGQAGHAGTTPMNLRQDSLVAAAEFICAVEKSAKDCCHGEVATVGNIEAKPGAANVIAARSTVSIDIRAQQDLVLEQLIDVIQRQAESISKRRNVELEWQWVHAAPAVACDNDMMHTFLEACSINGENTPLLPSGAGHDAMAIASLCPIAMLFIRSPGGISHHPEEAVLEGDVAKALRVMYSSLRIQATKS